MNPVSTGSAGNLDPSAILRQAENTLRDSHLEDKRSSQAAKEAAFKEEIDDGKFSIQKQRKAADERMKHGRKKSNGSLIGLGVGGALALIAVIAGAILCCIPGL